MVRTTIMLPEDVKRRAMAEARKLKVSFAAFVRQAVAERLPGQDPGVDRLNQRRQDPLFRLLDRLPLELLRKLMKSGRWNSESEIVRYGIDLVRREVEREQFSPYPENVLAEAYSKLTREERRQDERMGRGSAHPSPGELT